MPADTSRGHPKDPWILSERDKQFTGRALWMLCDSESTVQAVLSFTVWQVEDSCPRFSQYFIYTRARVCAGNIWPCFGILSVVFQASLFHISFPWLGLFFWITSLLMQTYWDPGNSLMLLPQQVRCGKRSHKEWIWSVLPKIIMSWCKWAYLTFSEEDIEQSKTLLLHSCA